MNNGVVYLRDIETSGYVSALEDQGNTIAGVSLDEWFTGSGERQFADAPLTSLHLPIEETPDPDLPPLSDWVSVADYGAYPGDWSNDSVAIQDAINAAVAAGKSTLYFPHDSGPNINESNGFDVRIRYDIFGKITIPPGIKRIVSETT